MSGRVGRPRPGRWSPSHRPGLPACGPVLRPDDCGVGQQTSSELTTLLTGDGTRWAAATVGAQSAAEMELASGSSVMAIGGWSGTDDSPTLEQFHAYVAAGQIHWFVPGGNQGGGPAGSTDSSSTAITEWVAAHYAATTVGGQTVYDLTAPAS